MSDPLFDTTDYRTFLEQALARRGMHQRDLAEALDRAPSNVSQVLGGRRALDPTLVERLVAVLELDAEQATYRAALVDLDSRSPRARRQAWATVQATQRHRAQAGPSSAVLEAASRWWFPVVMELARCEGFRPDPSWIAGTASPASSVTEAQQALNTAMALGLLVPDDHGGLRVTDEVQWTPSEVSTADQAANAAALHRAGMALAAGCQERARFNERQVRQGAIVDGEGPSRPPGDAGPPVPGRADHRRGGGPPTGGPAGADRGRERDRWYKRRHRALTWMWRAVGPRSAPFA